jgi:ribosomal protein L21E
MLTGTRFKLEIATLAANDLNGKLALTTIPAGDIVKVVADPSDGAGMLNVFWRGRTLVMFALDLKQRAIELKEGSATAGI